MPGLVPGIHVVCRVGKAWMAGTSPAMTREGPTIALALRLPGRAAPDFRLVDFPQPRSP